MSTQDVSKIGLAAVLLAALALLSATQKPASAELGHYDTTSSATVTSVTPGAPRGETITLTVPAGELMEEGLDPFGTGPGPIIFEPAGITITPGCNKAGYRDFNNNSVIDAGETPCLAQGDPAGTHTWNAALGILGNACNQTVILHVNLYNIALPNNEADPRLSTNIAFPHAQGTVDRFKRWRLGEPPLSGNNFPQSPGLEEEIVDVSPFDNRADANSFPIQNYPSYLLDLTDPDGVGPADPVIPLAVYGGLSGSVAGEWWPFYFMQFESGDLLAAFTGSSPHPYSRASAALGHPLQPVLGDPTAAVFAQPNVTDVCAPSAATINLSPTVGGVTRATNPAAGTHTVLAWRVSSRDLENDGYENAIDTCPATVNLEDPRNTWGPDGDSLDSACDPTPAAADDDPDGDGVLRAGDNCPLTANASQVDFERTYHPYDYFAQAFDGGPIDDRLGDACDSGDVTYTINNQSITTVRSPSVSNGHFHVRADVLPACYSTAPADADGDGYCAPGTAGCVTTCLTDSIATDSGSCTGTVPPSCAVRHNPWVSTNFAHLSGFDTDRGGGDYIGFSDPGGIGDGIACPGGVTDVCPNHSFDSDWFETYTGSNPAQACTEDTTANNEPLDSIMYDFNDSGAVNLSDISIMGGSSYGKFVNQAVSGTRFDVNADGAINLSDVSIMGGPPYSYDNCRRTDGVWARWPQ